MLKQAEQKDKMQKKGTTSNMLKSPSRFFNRSSMKPMIPGEAEPDDPGVLETDVLEVGRAIDNATPDRWQLELRALAKMANNIE